MAGAHPAQLSHYKGLIQMQALGIEQARHMTGCLEQRHPRADRFKRAVWRGSTGDHHIGPWLSSAQWHENVRVQLALRAANMSEIADFGLTHLFIGALVHSQCAHRQTQLEAN